MPIASTSVHIVSIWDQFSHAAKLHIMAGCMLTHVQSVLAQLLIEVSLRLGHVGIQDELLLAGQAVLHITLHPPQQKRLQDAVQLVHNLQHSHKPFDCKVFKDKAYVSKPCNDGLLLFMEP